MTRTNLREAFFGSLSHTSVVNRAVLTALRLYFNNRRHMHLRIDINADFMRLATVAPCLCKELQDKYYEILKRRCYRGRGKIDGWRENEFTCLWRDRERRIFENFDHIELVGYYDDQTSASLSWEQFNRARFEGASGVPIYRIVDRENQTFDFILRSWQRGGDPIQFL